MKKVLIAIALVGSMTGASMVASTAPALADGFNFSFNTGNVAMGFSDGYYDNNRKWHKWHNKREAREYRTRFSDRYREARHHDADHDGIPDNRDHHPNNPRRD